MVRQSSPGNLETKGKARGGGGGFQGGSKLPHGLGLLMRACVLTARTRHGGRVSIQSPPKGAVTLPVASRVILVLQLLWQATRKLGWDRGGAIVDAGDFSVEASVCDIVRRAVQANNKKRR